jgi:hypothetical protein
MDEEAFNLNLAFELARFIEDIIECIKNIDHAYQKTQ